MRGRPSPRHAARRSRSRRARARRRPRGSRASRSPTMRTGSRRAASASSGSSVGEELRCRVRREREHDARRPRTVARRRARPRSRRRTAERDARCPRPTERVRSSAFASAATSCPSRTQATRTAGTRPPHATAPRSPREHASVLELERAQVREGRAQRELLAVAAVDAGHERLDEPLVRLAARAGARRTRRSTRRRRGAAGGTSASAASRACPSGESSALSASASRFVGIIPVRPSGSGWSSPPRRTNERAFSGRRPTSSSREPELLAQPDAARLAREEAVRSRPR